MRKNFILRLVFLTSVTFSLHSCMHDEFSNPKQEQAPTSSFKVFRKDSNGKEPDYARGFAVLYWKYQELHPEFKQSVSKNLKESKPAVYFNMASEPLILDDGSRVVIYPVVEGSRIIGLAAGVLNHEENYVSYRTVSESTEGYENIISAFRLRFSMLPKDVLARVGGNGSGCNDISGCGETGGTTQIEPIVIKPRPRTIQWGGSGDGSEPWGNEPDGPPGGGCEGFGDCGGSTGNNPSAPEPPQNPCEKTKTIANNSGRQAGLNELRDKSKVGGEKGFMTKANGTPGPIVDGGEHHVQFGDITGYQGYSHNHTPSGVKMFSSRDIHKLFEFIIKQPPGAPIDNAFGEMIGSQVCPNCPGGYEYYNYIIRFNGTDQEAGNIYATNYDFDVLKEKYESFEQKLRPQAEYASQNGNFMNSKGLEEVFFYALEKMGIDKNKIILQKIDKDGKVTNVTLDANGKPKDVPCPN